MIKKLGLAAGIMIAVLNLGTGRAWAASSYEDYKSRYASLVSVDAVSNRDDGITVIEEQVFPFTFENFGDVKLIPVLDEKYGKIIICIADQKGKIVYKTDYIESNNWLSRSVVQPNDGLIAISFQDANQDGLTDIILICECSQKDGKQAGVKFKVADVLFQKKDGFYSNWEISDKLNRFAMNSNVDTIMQFTTGVDSMEFLYTARNFKEVTGNGFRVHEKHTFQVQFEEFGQVTVYPGFYPMGGLRNFLIYLVDSQGRICALLEPMGYYDDLVNLKAISFEDVNEDGLKDITVLANFRHCWAEYEEEELSYVTYFQNPLWFERDYDLEKRREEAAPPSIAQAIVQARKYIKKS